MPPPVQPPLIGKPVVKNHNRSVLDVPSDEIHNRGCRFVQVTVDPHNCSLCYSQRSSELLRECFAIPPRNEGNAFNIHSALAAILSVSVHATGEISLTIPKRFMSIETGRLRQPSRSLHLQSLLRVKAFKLP